MKANDFMKQCYIFTFKAIILSYNNWLYNTKKKMPKQLLRNVLNDFHFDRIKIIANYFYSNKNETF